MVNHICKGGESYKAVKEAQSKLSAVNIDETLIRQPPW